MFIALRTDGKYLNVFFYLYRYESSTGIPLHQHSNTIHGTDYPSLLARQQHLIEQHGVGLWDRIVGGDRNVATTASSAATANTGGTFFSLLVLIINTLLVCFVLCAFLDLTVVPNFVPNFVLVFVFFRGEQTSSGTFWQLRCGIGGGGAA